MVSIDEKRAFSERLIGICDKAGIPERGRAAKLGKLFNRTTKAAEKWLRGLSIPEWPIRVAMVKRWNLNAQWFESGLGRPYAPQIDFDDKLQWVCEAYSRLLKDGQQALIDYTDKLIEEQEARSKATRSRKPVIYQGPERRAAHPDAGYYGAERRTRNSGQESVTQALRPLPRP